MKHMSRSSIFVGSLLFLGSFSLLNFLINSAKERNLSFVSSLAGSCFFLSCCVDSIVCCLKKFL